MAADTAPFDGWTVRHTGDCKELSPGPPRKSGKGHRASRPVPAWTFEQAWERFEQVYPQGFADARYPRGERDWKWERHEIWRQLFPPGTLARLARTDPERAGKYVMRVVQTTVVPLPTR